MGNLFCIVSEIILELNTADKLLETVRKRGKKPTEDGKATFISDCNDQYITAILANFEAETVNYGQLIKERESCRVVCKTRMVIFGEVDDAGIGIVYVGRYNLTLGHGISRLAGQEKFVLFQVQGDVGQPFRRVSVLQQTDPG